MDYGQLVVLRDRYMTLVDGHLILKDGHMTLVDGHVISQDEHMALAADVCWNTLTTP
jgi:hypothetical protein